MGHRLVEINLTGAGGWAGSKNPNPNQDFHSNDDLSTPESESIPGPPSHTKFPNVANEFTETTPTPNRPPDHPASGVPAPDSAPVPDIPAPTNLTTPDLAPDRVPDSGSLPTKQKSKYKRLPKWEPKIKPEAGPTAREEQLERKIHSLEGSIEEIFTALLKLDTLVQEKASETLQTI